MYRKFDRSYLLLIQSFNILRKDKKLLFFTFYGFAILVLITGLYLGSVIAIIEISYQYRFNQINPNYILVLLAVITILVWFSCCIILIYFEAGLTGCAYKRLKGEDAPFSYGMQIAASHRGKIFKWALMELTFGMLLGISVALDEKLKGLLRIITGTAILVATLTWEIAELFVVPVLIFENDNIVGAMKRSGVLFKKSWGESIMGEYSISSLTNLLALPGLLLFFAVIVAGLGNIDTIVAVVVMVVSLLVAAVLGKTLNTIYITALYIYATEGKIIQGFSSEVIQNAFKPAKEMRAKS